MQSGSLPSPPAARIHRGRLTIGWPWAAKALPLTLVLGLCLALFWPALFGGMTLAHGDAIVHGLPMLTYHADALAGYESMLWSDKVYGGHALLAEAQTAFLSPLNLVLDALVDPRYCHGLFHFLCMVIAASGMYRLSRSLDLDRWGAAFAAVALVFCTSWLLSQGNMTITGTLSWLPWAMWSVERWYQRPGLLNTMTMALLCSLVVLAGYLQLAHGLALYIFFALASPLLLRSERLHLFAHWKPMLGYGALAVFIALGVCAIQLLPLMELIPYSIRKDGTALLFYSPMIDYLRGAVLPTTGNALGLVPSLGSPLTAALFAASLPMRKPPRVMGHAIAAVALIALGATTPLFMFAYEHHLVPGLNYFRSMQAYIGVAMIPVALLAGHLCSELRRAAAVGSGPARTHFLPVAVAAVLALCTVAASTLSLMPAGQLIGMTSSIVALLAAPLLWRSGRLRYFPALAFVLLLIECLVLRFDTFRMVDKSYLAMPGTVRTIRQDPAFGRYKLYDSTGSALAVFTPPHSEALGPNTGRLIAAVGGMTNLLWGIPSLDGSMALYTERSQIASKAVASELQQSASHGQRLLDILSIRYVSSSSDPIAAGLHRIYLDRTYDIRLLRNDRALPPVRLYANHHYVRDAQHALELLHASGTQVLALEGGGNAPGPTTDTGQECGADDAIQEVSHASTRYVAVVTTTRPCWLFFADAPYASWVAQVNGKRATVYPAQVLGRAIYLPPGRNEVVTKFTSSPFRAGRAITVVALLLLATMLALVWRRQKRLLAF
ncbi:hypothetical protein DT603_14455 [Pseudoxanthomonas gei]|uniref:YfhO family protein n=1 Tax=Pseudoxanthomonas gei TaxID=1383030 RepID=A0ABX0AHI2_9GAMM|nr:hypothetical protein [Pseudoxanthomonas gei]NDK40042.1 hypothetical protein [Pseudoxanthomonas gei]